MIRPVAIEGARAAALPARSLLALALLTAAPAWAQSSPSVADAAATSAATVSPVAKNVAMSEPGSQSPAADSRAASPQPMATSADAHEPSDTHDVAAAMASDGVPANAGTRAQDTPSPALPAQDATPAPPSPQVAPATPATPQDTDPAPATPPPASDARAAQQTEPASTAAESDFDALYGSPNTGDGQAVTPATTYDPWEGYNRRVHRFNNVVDRRVAKPLAKAYVRIVPRPIRSGVSNFFSNLGQPASAVNALLQGRPRQAAHSLGRFVLNSTLGIGGIFDPATDAHLDNRNEDFGQTLGVWGWKRSRFVELPLFGPRTLRDVVGMTGDAPLSPMRQVQADRVRVPLQGLQLVDLRMQLMSTDALREGAADDYQLVRDAWMQRRAYQIDEDRAGDDVPDYLKDDPAMVPVDAMPVSGGR